MNEIEREERLQILSEMTDELLASCEEKPNEVFFFNLMDDELERMTDKRYKITVEMDK